MSYTSSSPALSNKETYPLFSRTIFPDDGLNPARIEILKRFNWTRVAIIYENHEVFSLVRGITSFVAERVKRNFFDILKFKATVA